jgi:hypothetical protein
MDPRLTQKLACRFLLCGIFGALLVTAVASQDVSSLAAQYGIDAKQARAMAAQIEIRKTAVFYAVSDFEKSLFTGNTAACERQLDKSAALSLNGVPINTCEELIDHRRVSNDQRLKLRNQVVQFTSTDPAASVSVDVMPGGQHDVLTLTQRGGRWLVASFTGAPMQLAEKSKSPMQ